MRNSVNVGYCVEVQHTCTCTCIYIHIRIYMYMNAQKYNVPQRGAGLPPQVAGCADVETGSGVPALEVTSVSQCSLQTIFTNVQ